MSLKSISFSEAMKRLTAILALGHQITDNDYHVVVGRSYCAGVLLSDGSAVVHDYGCNGPISDVTPECQYWSSFYVLPAGCANHDQLPLNTTCQVCGKVKGRA